MQIQRMRSHSVLPTGLGNVSTGYPLRPDRLGLGEWLNNLACPLAICLAWWS